jgi:CHAT domain-containing protein
LAGANRRNANSGGGGGDDGILTALEASGLNLWGTKLVVLSACDTGVGEIKNGEGVYGLRRAFVLAGAESLVMSLWPVSDFVTRELMTGYYKNLKQGFGRGAALRQVQIEMLNKTGRRHPFYWAGFIQSGDWSALGNGATTPPAAARSAEMK